jgi:hypothetical protein
MYKAKNECFAVVKCGDVPLVEQIETERSLRPPMRRGYLQRHITPWMYVFVSRITQL